MFAGHSNFNLRQSFKMKTTTTRLLLSVLFLVGLSQAYVEPNCDGKQVIVHLFEWSWDAIAQECENFLGPKGFCGVQVSPPNEHIQGGAWWTRYQPVSYKLESRSGNREQFANMVRRCNAAGVNVIADLVINHMAGNDGAGVGTGGSSYNGYNQDFPGVPFSSWDFHQPYCRINNYQDPTEIRNCYLGSLNDLDGGKDYVRGKIADYINDLINLGVKGFRVDASKHMWPGDLENILGRLSSTPMIIHEVIDMGNEPIHTSDYYHLGKVTEFRSCTWVACLRNGDFNCLNNFGQGITDGLHALVFVDNHDNQRNHGGGGDILTYKADYNYKLAVGFMLAQEYGFKRVMSSYYFDNSDQGPPGGQPNPQGDCGNGWVCEHRWSSIANMVKFANTVAGAKQENWQVKDGSLGFSRGQKGFFAMGNLNNVNFFTGLPDGDYCDIIHDCQQTITVSNGFANFNKAQDNDPVAAICVGCN